MVGSEGQASVPGPGPLAPPGVDGVCGSGWFGSYHLLLGSQRLSLCQVVEEISFSCKLPEQYISAGPESLFPCVPGRLSLF